MKVSVTLLYVDDEPINLMLFTTLFKKKYTVLSAESGFLGLETLKAHPEIQVIISDMKMPGMNGIEFIQKAKAMFPGIIYYILTGYEITPEIKRSLENGLISQYFQKPLNLHLIDNAITTKLQIT